MSSSESLLQFLQFFSWLSKALDFVKMAGRLPVGITCFAKWFDDTWYNVEILAKNEASYTVTYIDYGISEDVLEGDIVGDVGEIPDTDYIDQFVKIKDPM